MTTDDLKDPNVDPTNPIQVLNEQLDERTGDLIDANAKMTRICRSQAQDLLKIAMAYDNLAEMARACADMNAEMARQAAQITGDIIKQEWGLLDEEDIEDDEDDDYDEDEDDDTEE